MKPKAVTIPTRPFPPAAMVQTVAGGVFAPAMDVWAWARAAFVTEDAPLLNEDHRHLRPARIGVIWTNTPNTRQMRRVVGMAEAPQPPRSKWGTEALAAFLCNQWFGPVDFRVYLDARYAAQADDLSWCALVEHELYHCGHRRDRFGIPMWSKTTGLPKYGLRGHDAEEHVGIIRRYGLDGAAGGVRELVAAAARPPEIGRAQVVGVCGTCELRIAA